MSGTLKKTTSFLKSQQQQKLRDQIQQLRNIRQMMFQTFDDYSQSLNNSQSEKGFTRDSEEEERNQRLITKEVVNNNPTPITDQESVASTQVYDHMYRKLRATVQLLSESLEEQGNLKALLELTFNPSVYEAALQSEILHLSQFIHPTSANESHLLLVPDTGKVSMSAELLQNIKYRSLVLEREQLMSKVRIYSFLLLGAFNT